MLPILFVAGCSKPAPVQPVNHAQPKRPPLTATEEFNLRGRCAEIVQKDYLSLGGLVGAALSSEVTPHYNPETNRCYAKSYTTKNWSYSSAHRDVAPIPDNYVTIGLYDAQTREMLAFASQEGDKSHGNIWSSGGQNESFTTFDKARDYIDTMMEAAQ